MKIEVQSDVWIEDYIIVKFEKTEFLSVIFIPFIVKVTTWFDFLILWIKCSIQINEHEHSQKVEISIKRKAPIERCFFLYIRSFCKGSTQSNVLIEDFVHHVNHSNNIVRFTITWNKITNKISIFINLKPIYSIITIISIVHIRWSSQIPYK